MSLEARKPTILSMAEKFLSKEFFNKLLLGLIRNSNSVSQYSLFLYLCIIADPVKQQQNW